MPTKRIPGGYADNNELARAMRANQHARATVGRVLDLAGQHNGRLSWLYPLLADLAHDLGVITEALAEMRRIRDNAEEDDE